MRPALALALLCLSLSKFASAQTSAELAQQVRDAETSFAATMADRDLKAFATYVADEAVFFGQQRQVRFTK